MASSSLVEPNTSQNSAAVTWSEEATLQLIEIWGDETMQFSFDAAKTSKAGIGAGLQNSAGK